MRICRYNYITYGNDFDFKCLYLRELGYIAPSAALRTDHANA